ncbi:VWA domain-containing protein [Bdellovibrio bacteriovorus]|uniref:vWA domain-containing protein n=1 Tax=Bdellovibrio bacteriovorus TaxID=959 RepID=UPI0021D0AEE9|nr:VWA domain-containing protein [Bdellovibrio bacteriovorus]UXR66110.1 VWA domain-containing protein [Bdellovibrio bacteriovorus]
MFRFENIAAFNYLWLIPVIILIGIFFDRRARKKMETAIGSRLYPFLSSSVSRKKRSIKTALQVLAVLCFVIALARPQMGESQQEVKSEGVEIIFAVDVSESMMAEDVKPSRLAQAKAELSRLVDLMPGNKVGIVAFAGSAALLSPLTNDPGAIKMYLESLEPSSVSSQGTNFTEALKISKEAFERGGVTTDDTVKVTRVILIASDGEDHEQGALDEAQKMAKEGVRIFSLAYGTEKGGAIPVRDGMGFLKGYKKDRQGQTILTTVKGDALRALAEAGQGSFYFATFGGEQTKLLVEDISKLEKAQFDTTMAVQYEERFQTILMIGIIIALLELFMGERRTSFRFWKGRYEVPPA